MASPQSEDHSPRRVEPTSPSGSSATVIGWLAVFGLTGFAVAVPLFRVLGPSPEFFLAHDVGPSGVVMFAVMVGLVVPATVATAATVMGRRSNRVRGVIVAALGTVAAAGLLQAIAGLGLFPFVVLGVGAGLATVEARISEVRAGLAALTLVSLLAAGWFVGLSRTSTYVFADAASVIDVAGAEESEEPLSPVVVVVFDELPAPALLGSDLAINQERFPNFARLAAQSDWYRLASSVSPQTAYSVPALLSGIAPTGDVGVASNYPSNLFLQLGATHQTFGYEPVTGLCPDALCEDQPTEAVETAPRPVAATENRLVNDTLVVFGHAVGSDAMRDGLPAIDHSWSGFDGRPIDVVEVDADPEKGRYQELGTEATFVGASARLLALTAQRPTTERPPMYVAHVITPHLPYVANPSGSIYEKRALVGMSTENSTLVWPASVHEAARAQGYQRLLLQLGAVDTLLGQVIDQLEVDGVWDDAVVVVTADHGASFEEGAFRSVREGGAEVWNVPLFVKHPGQTEGRVLDDAALTIDVVPTVLGAIGAESPSDFDGIDLAEGRTPAVRPDGYDGGGTPLTIDASIDAVRDVVDRRSAWIDPDGGWAPVYRLGPGGDLVGSPVPDSRGGAGTWRAPTPRSGVVPTVQHLALDLDGQPVPDGVVVAAGGQVVGTGAPLVPTGDGTYEVTVVVDEATASGGAPLDVYTVGPDATLTRLSRS